MIHSKTLFFRCDANSDSGMGHFIRCYEIAKTFQKLPTKSEVFFVGNYNSLAIQMLEEEKIAYRTLPLDQTLNPELLIQLLPSNAVLWLDSYEFQQRYLNTLTAKGVIWGSFDDMCKNDFSGALFLVNFCLGKSREDYEFPAREILLGPQYLPIQSHLRAVRLENLKRREVSIKHILICIGTYDRYQSAPLIARLALESFPDANISYFGQAAPEDLRLTQFDFSTSFPQFLAQADLVICGGGRLKYEASYAAIPFATIAQTELELQDTQNFVTRKLARDLGKAYEIDEAEIKRQFQAIQEEEDWSSFYTASESYFYTDSNSKLSSQIHHCIENSCALQ